MDPDYTEGNKKLEMARRDLVAAAHTFYVEGGTANEAKLEAQVGKVMTPPGQYPCDMNADSPRLEAARKALQEAAREFYVQGGTSPQLQEEVAVGNVLDEEDRLRHNLEMHKRQESGVVIT
jgi:hypothetical protein